MERRSEMVAALLLALFVGGCCTAGNQEVMRIKSHPEKDATIVKTRDRCTDETRFWHCQRKGDELVCNRSCGDNVRHCASDPGSFRTDRAASAHQGSNDDQPTAAPTQDSSESREDDESNGSEESTEKTDSDTSTNADQSDGGEPESSGGDLASPDGNASSDGKTNSSPSGDE